jgi:hypothetical protein
VPTPYQQGELDSLCSVYAVINAVMSAAEPHKKLTKKDCVDLFAFLACTLKLENKLLCVLVSGGHYPTVARLLRAAHCWLIKRHRLTLTYRRPFYRKQSRGMTHVRRKLRNHVAQPNCSAIVRITGAHEHWTVVSRVSARTETIHLFDSGDLSYVSRDSQAARTRPAAAALVVYDTIFLRVGSSRRNTKSGTRQRMT